MPCIVGAVKILSVGSSAVVQFGDSIQITPSSTSKSYAGAGSFVTGDLPRTNNFISSTSTLDDDIQDASENSAGNQGVI